MKPLTKPGDWIRLEEGIQRALPSFLGAQRWYGGKTRTIASLSILDAIPIPLPDGAACVLLQRIDYGDGSSETYLIPLLERQGNPEDNQPSDNRPTLTIQTQDGKKHLFSDALWDQAFLQVLLEMLAGGKRFSGWKGELAGIPTSSLEPLLRAGGGNVEASRMKAEQSNTSVLYGRSLVLKFFRRMERGINPDYEIGAFLTQETEFSHVPAVAGALEYQDHTAQPSTLGILQAFVANQGDAWKETWKAVSDYFDRVEKLAQRVPAETSQNRSLLTAALTPPNSLESELLGQYQRAAHLLGRRTSELHLALASGLKNANFAPEPFSASYQRALCDSMIVLAREALGMLRARVADLPSELADKARSILSSENGILEQFQLLRKRPLTGLRTRVHGDFHLGQVLCTGDDFVFIDFEGEPVRTLAERREKHSPLRDIAGMVRSFHYAAYAVSFQRAEAPSAGGAGLQTLSPFANLWYTQAATEYLRGYLETASGADFMPSGREELEWFFDTLLLEKAVYELKYELSHRLSWVRIPLEGLYVLLASLDASNHDR